MPSAALCFIDMLFSSSGFPSKSVIVIAVVLLSPSPALCRDFICTDTAHVAQPHGVAFATGSRLGIIGGDDALLIADRWPIAPMHLLAPLLVMLSEELAHQRHFPHRAHALPGLRLIACTHN